MDLAPYLENCLSVNTGMSFPLMLSTCVCFSTVVGTPARPWREQSTVILALRHRHSHLRGQAPCAGAIKSARRARRSMVMARMSS